MIIGLTGKAGVGKDTVADMIVNASNKEWEKRSFAYALREIACILTGLPFDSFVGENKNKFLSNWGMSVRQFLQRLGTEAIREGLHTDAWVMALMSKYYPEVNWIITDVRFENEAKCIRENGGIVCFIDRAIEKDNPIYTHASEAGFSGYLIDRFIKNDGTLLDLDDEVKSVLGDLF